MFCLSAISLLITTLFQSALVYAQDSKKSETPLPMVLGLCESDTDCGENQICTSLFHRSGQDKKKACYHQCEDVHAACQTSSAQVGQCVKWAHTGLICVGRADQHQACGDLTNMSNLYATITKETGSPSINDSWGTSTAYSPAQGALTTDGVCSPRVLHNRQEMSCFATSTSLYGANTAGSKGFYWDSGTASCQSSSPRNTGWSSYYINKHDGNGGNENRFITFWVNNGANGSITINGGGLTYGSNSDYRLKKDDVVLTGAIARVKQLRPIKYKWIEGNIDDEGFFAHEAQAVVPVAVEGTKDQVVLQSEVDAGTQPENKSAGEPIYQTMDNSKLIPVLTAALKEAIEKIETLEAKVAALESS